jgi:two-component system NtrC family sensor kinase
MPPLPRWISVLRSPSFGLFFGLFALVIAAFAGYALLVDQATERQWRGSVESGALAWTELIRHVTRHSMLLNRKEELDPILRTVAATPGVIGVRIYDRRGVIVHSADAAEVGRRVDRGSEVCVACHTTARPRVSVPPAERVRVFAGPDGHRALGLIDPIENAPDCSGAGCHAHAPGQSILGVLDVTMSMEEADHRLAASRRLSFMAAALLALLVGAGSGVFIRRFHRLEQKMLADTAELTHAQRQVVHMEKMASLGTLAATVAHELNNPLAGILNYAKLVERSLAEDEIKVQEASEVRRFLHVIQQEAGRCGKIVSNFLLFARRSGGELAVHALSPIADQSLAILHHHLEMSRVGLVWTPLAAGDEVLCDAGQIQQALLDLFVNAIEAMPEGGTLTVAVVPRAGEVEISVVDTGIGIPPEAMPRIYEPFFTTKEGKVGAGLGLSVVYGIVERHGGRIDVESEVGKGTAFRLTLPRQRRQDP